jgi:uncharacterized protein YjiS (DUF1127 family)
MNREHHFEVAEAGPRPTFQSPSDCGPVVAPAQRERAAATARLFGAVSDAVCGALRPVLTPVIRWGKRRATRAALMRCSDRVLADIGVERADIPLVAKSVVPAEHQPALRGWWATAREYLDGARSARRERRGVYRELDAYSDRELDEIGLRRVDIPAIARAHERLRRAA